MGKGLIHQKHERQRKREAARKAAEAKNAPAAPAAQVPASVEPIIPGPTQDDSVSAAVAARGQSSSDGGNSSFGKSDSAGTAFGKSQGSGSAFGKFNPMTSF